MNLSEVSVLPAGCKKRNVPKPHSQGSAQEILQRVPTFIFAKFLSRNEDSIFVSDLIPYLVDVVYIVNL